MKLLSKVITLFFYTVLAIGSICSVRQLDASSMSSMDKAIEESLDLEKKSTAAIKKFIDENQQGRFTYISSGPFDFFPREADFGIWVTANTRETIQSGRALALTFIGAYLSELMNNIDTKKWHECQCTMFPNHNRGSLSLKNVGVRIAFWDENVERPKTPYLSEIDFYQGTFRYYEADPKTQALKLVLEESYQDAVKNLESTQVK